MLGHQVSIVQDVRGHWAVVCSAGCDLGTSRQQPSYMEAQQRAEMHEAAAALVSERRGR